MRKSYQKVGGLALLFIALYLSYLILKPFLLTIVASGLMAYLFHPVYRFFHMIFRFKTLSSLLTCLTIILIVFIPMVYVVSSLISEAPKVYSIVSGIISGEQLTKFVTEFRLPFDISSLVNSLASGVLVFFRFILSTIPQKIINTGLSIFLIFFFFIEGEALIAQIKRFLPFSKKNLDVVFSHSQQLIDAVVYGQLITAMLQSALATAAYYMLGLETPLFWGVLTLIFSLIPLIGPSIVYIPLGAGTILTGMSTGQPGLIGKGAILLVFGFAIVSSVDNFVKPLLIGDKVKMHPMLIFLGVMGGLAKFGILGIILGPLILIFLLTLLQIFDAENNPST